MRLTSRLLLPYGIRKLKSLPAAAAKRRILASGLERAQAQLVKSAEGVQEPERRTLDFEDVVSAAAILS